jgi:hypothetical protein
MIKTFLLRLLVVLVVVSGVLTVVAGCYKQLPAPHTDAVRLWTGGVGNKE